MDMKINLRPSRGHKYLLFDMSMFIINSCHAKQLSPKKGKYKMRKIKIGVGGVLC